MLAGLTVLAPGAVRGEAWRVDPALSSLVFVADREFPDANNPVRFTTLIEHWQASIDFDADYPAEAAVRVTMAMTSLSTDDGMTSMEMSGPNWFDVTAHPEAFYEAQGFAPIGEGRYRADGYLTLLGITAPVPITFDLLIEDDVARASGGGAVTRMDFGVGRRAGPGLASPVASVRFDLVAARAQP